MIPFGIERMSDIYSPGVMQGTAGQGWVWAVSEPYSANPLERIRAAWWVLTGRAQAMIRPKAGDLEQALGIKHDQRNARARR